MSAFDVPAGAWRKSSACQVNNACVEVARVWRTSGYSWADCVAVAVIGED